MDSSPQVPPDTFETTRLKGKDGTLFTSIFNGQSGILQPGRGTPTLMLFIQLTDLSIPLFFQLLSFLITS